MDKSTFEAYYFKTLIKQTQFNDNRFCLGLVYCKGERVL